MLGHDNNGIFNSSQKRKKWAVSWRQINAINLHVWPNVDDEKSPHCVSYWNIKKTYGDMNSFSYVVSSCLYYDTWRRFHATDAAVSDLPGSNFARCGVNWYMSSIAIICMNV